MGNGTIAQALTERLANDAVVTHYVNVLWPASFVIRFVSYVSYLAGIVLMTIGTVDLVLTILSADPEEIASVATNPFHSGLFVAGVALVGGAVIALLVKDLLVNSSKVRSSVIAAYREVPLVYSPTA